MSEEEIKDEVKEPDAKEPEVKEPVDGNPIEALAMKLGWNPNHEDTERPFLSAEDYILKSKEIQNTSNKELKKRSREISELRNGLQALEKHYESLYGAQIMNLKNQLAELKRRRRDADRDGDDALVRELDGQIEEIGKVPAKPPKTVTNLDPVFTGWLDENEWYEQDEDLRSYADMLGEKPEYKALFEAKGYKTMLDKVAEATKKVFPEKFGHTRQAPSRPSAPPVEPSQRRQPPGKTKLTYRDLPREAQDMCDQFVKLGVMTREKYLEDYEIKMNAS